MNTADPYGAGDDNFDDLPQLPIPRPGEWSPMAAAAQPSEPRLAPPSLGGGLGGGASFTAAGDGVEAEAAPTNSLPNVGVELEQSDRERVDAERFTWELAARLTSGMLANPARGGSSVKDAMGLFDQLLQEMHSYTRIASEFDLLGHEAARRSAHEAYFQQRAGNVSQPAAEHPVPGAVSPPAPSSAPSVATPKPEPTQPRPMGEYRPIPPGSRAPYSPGSMAGSPPPERQPGDTGEQAA